MKKSHECTAGALICMLISMAAGCLTTLMLGDDWRVCVKCPLHSRGHRGGKRRQEANVKLGADTLTFIPKCCRNAADDDAAGCCEQCLSLFSSSARVVCGGGGGALFASLRQSSAASKCEAVSVSVCGGVCARSRNPSCERRHGTWRRRSVATLRCGDFALVCLHSRVGGRSCCGCLKWALLGACAPRHIVYAHTLRSIR